MDREEASRNSLRGKQAKKTVTALRLETAHIGKAMWCCRGGELHRGSSFSFVKTARQGGRPKHKKLKSECRTVTCHIMVVILKSNLLLCFDVKTL